MPDIYFFNPDGLPKPSSPYQQVARVRAAETVYIAGQVSVDQDGRLVGKNDFEAQCVQVFANVETALRAVGAGWSNIVQFTSYIVRPDDLPAFRDFRTREFPRMFPADRYPPNTAVIARLANPDYLLEIQVVAAI
jgi:enamine deaminase RidA (YjgF/YER057c/UK114 family)